MHYLFITLACLLTPANPFSSQAVSSLERYHPTPPPYPTHPLFVVHWVSLIEAWGRGFLIEAWAPHQWLYTKENIAPSSDEHKLHQQSQGGMGPHESLPPLYQSGAAQSWYAEAMHIQKDRSHDDVPLLQALHASAPLTEEAMFPEPWTEWSRHPI